MKIQCHIVKWVEVDDTYAQLVGKSEFDDDPKLEELREALYTEAERASGAKWEWDSFKDDDLLTQVIYEYPDKQRQEVLCYC